MSGPQKPRTTLEQLTDQERAAWSNLHGSGSRRGRLQPLTPVEQAEFTPFAEVLARAKDAGFRPRHLISDARERPHQDGSELKVFRERPDGPTEVIVFRSHQWAQAFRVPRGAPLLGRFELEEEPGRLLNLVLAGAWPEAGEDRD
ncbi:MAG: hypothetical protein ACRDTE_11605 [Pseudonocardiaceae bacterium]